MPKKLLVCIFALPFILLLASCAPTPDRAPDESRAEPVPETTTEEEARSAEQWLDEARRATQVQQQLLALVNAAESFLNAEQVDQAGAILTQLDIRRMRPALAYRYQLQKARFYAALQQWDLAKTELEGLADQLTQRDERVAALKLSSDIHYAQEQHLPSARQLMVAQNYDRNENYAPLIFDRLSQVKSSYWRSPEPEANQVSRGWVQLMVYLTQALDRYSSVSQAMTVWQRNFPDHPATAISEQLQAESRLNEYTTIAVLLPEHGPLATQGKAVRDGLLSALADKSYQVHFFNSANADFDVLINELRDLNPDYVIGPLDRDAVNTLIRYEDRPWTQLWLNQTNEYRHITERDTFFALDLGSETEYASNWLAQRGYQHALIAGPEGSRGRELAEIFSGNWLAHNPQGSVRSTHYSSATEMQDAIREALHVAASESRKDRVEQSLGARDLHHELRNRQDIDVVYLLGDAAQARLVKPFIEVSLSAFSERLPVYANSSVNQQRNLVGVSDITGLRFTESPWILPGHPNDELREQLITYNSGWGISQQRLAAMGYDSIQLLQRLHWMRQLPGYQFNGFTGRLRIVDGKLARELDWAIFDQQQIRREWSTYVEGNGR